MTREQTEASDSAAAFADALADLKQRGSMLLLAGVGQEALDAACGRLLGDDGTTSRRELVVSTSRPTPDAGTDPPTRIHYRMDARSAAAVDAGGPASPGLPVGPSADDRLRTVDGGLSELLEEIDDAVQSIDVAADGLDPAELRICIDSADAIVAAHDRERAFEFFHGLSGLLAGARAMGHVHLPATFDDETVQTVAPLFDAVIEVRGGNTQRWHLREPEITTDWLSL